MLDADAEDAFEPIHPARRSSGLLPVKSSTTGKSCLDVQQAFEDPGIDAAGAAALAGQPYLLVAGFS